MGCWLAQAPCRAFQAPPRHLSPCYELHSPGQCGHSAGTSGQRVIILSVIIIIIVVIVGVIALVVRSSRSSSGSSNNNNSNSHGDSNKSLGKLARALAIFRNLFML